MTIECLDMSNSMSENSIQLMHFPFLFIWFEVAGTLVLNPFEGSTKGVGMNVRLDSQVYA
jgi:hypothetical protein